MICVVQTCALVGLEPHSVLCEVDLMPQLPTFTLVGLPSSMTQESRERVRAAVLNSDFEWPSRKVTINLLPANLPKWGSHFELAMALGILGANLERPTSLRTLAIGELSLSGEVRPCGWTAIVSHWLEALALQTQSQDGQPLLVIAHEEDIRELNAISPRLSKSCDLVGVRTLAQAFQYWAEASLRSKVHPNKTAQTLVRSPKIEKAQNFELLSQVRDEPLGVVAALVAIAGRHHVLFAGPHGMGKSMLLRAICEAANPLTESELSMRKSILKTFGESFGEAATEDFNQPTVRLQTSITRAGLEGAVVASGQVTPGEFTRAHFGILVADEFLEYRRDVIESFRQPLDDGFVRLQRAKFRTALPSKFQLLASTNLCPCGYFGKTRNKCVCLATKRQAYQQKMSGPIMDRFDLVVIVGQRGSSLRRIQIPADVEPLIDRLVDPKKWSEQVAAALNKSHSDSDPATLWSEVTCNASDRGRLKLAKVAKTLAGLLGEPRTAKHLRLALCLRQELDILLKPELRHSLGDFAEARKKLVESASVSPSRQ